MILRRCLPLLLLAALAACARAPVREEHTPPPGVTHVPAPTPPVVAVPESKLPRAGNPPFYDVLGRRYHVLPSSDGYHERGVASWYGGEFHGRRTANGETYDMHSLTAAHKTLPLPSYVRVTNLRNGRSVVVRVNDRGPFVRNRIIDLSLGAAELLDMTRDGTGLVEVETVVLEDDDGSLAATEPAVLLDPASMLAPEAAAPSEPPLEERLLYVQVGAFGDPFNARRMHERLTTLGFSNVAVVSDSADAHPLYRVRLGPLPDVNAYDRLVERLTAAAIDDIYLSLD